MAALARAFGFFFDALSSLRHGGEGSRVRACSHPLARGCRGDRDVRGAFGAKLCDASTPRTFGPHKGLSLALLADRFTASPPASLPPPFLPRLFLSPPTPFWTCYVEYSTVSLDRKIFFRPRAIDEGKIRHVARESRYLLCNLRESRGYSYVARILMAPRIKSIAVTRSFRKSVSRPVFCLVRAG